ncbi:CLK4-associating serine/arginine rich protein [Frankliniella fusca]|uniref:CLK4-associating serine/arginine rich protein n=1 Tax=Frankliniella fusca TaxID=407009 RepID=A0AAE1H093_9NEOP|nr:CLK4-associating serine/arginine rich protein [Frankliniella fusca]
MMWHEARKQEKKIRGMIVDYHRRAERRRDYYEKIKADPTQFLQIHGRPCKIHLDPAVAAAGDSPANMMPWQGQVDTLIDRFDVRAHLDFIPQPQDDGEDSPNLEERQSNYERYRILVQNEFLGVPEEKFLRQLYLEEQFGPVGGQQSKEPPPNPDKKGKKVPGAAIGYVYEDDSPSVGVGSGPTPLPSPVVAPPLATKIDKDETKIDDNAEDEDEDSDVDFDMCLDVSKIDTKQAHEMNRCGLSYGMSGNDFFSFLTDDFEEQEALKLAREQEEEKAMFAGRKSRRERRAFREKKLVGRKISPPSYATRSSPTYDPYRISPNSRSKSKSQSRSRSTSPINAGEIQYITCFGGEEDGAPIGVSSGKQISKPVLKEPIKRVTKRSHSSSSDHQNLGPGLALIRDLDHVLCQEENQVADEEGVLLQVHLDHPQGLVPDLVQGLAQGFTPDPERGHLPDLHMIVVIIQEGPDQGIDHRVLGDKEAAHLGQEAHQEQGLGLACQNSIASMPKDLLLLFQIFRRRSRSNSLRRSHSPKFTGKKNVTADHQTQPQQPVQRYYGRRKGNDSSSDLEASDTEDSSTLSGGVGASSGSNLNKSNRSGSGNSRPAAKVSKNH